MADQYSGFALIRARLCSSALCKRNALDTEQRDGRAEEHKQAYHNIVDKVDKHVCLDVHGLVGVRGGQCALRAELGLDRTTQRICTSDDSTNERV